MVQIEQEKMSGGTIIDHNDKDKNPMPIGEVNEPVTQRSMDKSDCRKQTKKVNEIDPETTEHMVSYRDTLVHLSRFGIFFGQKPDYNWDPSKTFAYWNTYNVLISAWLGIVYTISFHIYHGNYSRVMEPMAIFGIAASCLLKWIFYVKYFRHIYSMVFFPKKLCLLNPTGPRADIIKEGLHNTVKVLNLFLVGIVTALSIFFLVPLYSLIIENEKIPIMPVEFPFLDQSQLSEFLTAQLVMIMIGIYGNFGTVMFGSGFLICVYNYSFQVKLIVQDFKELDEMWSRPSTTTLQHRYAYLSNICLKVQDMNRYLECVKKCYQLKFCFYFFFNFFAQVVCLYEVTVDHWKGGVTVMFVEFLEMLFYCAVGTKLTTEGENLCDIIYNCDWYIYDLRSQKLLRMLLHYQQRPKHIMLGPIAPLNLVTLVMITKKMYSMYTVIVETV